MAKSSNLNPQTIIADIKEGKPAPLYFLQGDEPFFIDQISDYIEKNLLPEDQKGFNQSIIYGKDSDINTVISAAKRFPMMAEKQVVIVKEAQDLKDLDKTVKSKVAGKEIEFNALEEYAQKPLTTTVLVFCYKNKVLDGRKALAKVLDEKAILFTSKGFADYQMQQLGEWIQANVKSKGYNISEKATFLLIEFVGNNLSRLSSEIDKIIVNLKDKATIDENHVSTFVGISKEYNIFELQKAFSVKDFNKAIKIVHYFSENPKENPIQMNLGNLYGYFVKLMQIKASAVKDENEAARVIGLPPFVAREYISASKKYSDQKILQIFGYLREADMNSKGFNTSTIDESGIMKELVVKVMS